MRAFNYHCFNRYILNYHGNFVIVEDYQDGDLYTDDEVWGSYVFDLKNNKYLEIPFHFLGAYGCDKIADLDSHDEEEWQSIDDDYSFLPDDEVRAYYEKEIEELDDEVNIVKLDGV